VRTGTTTAFGLSGELCTDDEDGGGVIMAEEPASWLAVPSVFVKKLVMGVWAASGVAAFWRLGAGVDVASTEACRLPLEIFGAMVVAFVVEYLMKWYI